MKTYNEIIIEKYDKILKEFKVKPTEHTIQTLKSYENHITNNEFIKNYEPKLKEINGLLYEIINYKSDYLNQIKQKENLNILGSDTGYNAYLNSTLDNFYQTSEQRKIALKTAKSFINGDLGENKSLYIYGSYRSGKTYLASAIANEISKSKTVCFVFMPDFTRIFLSFNKNNNLEEKIKILKTCDLLILDDIGAGTISPWVRDSILLPIIQERMNNNKNNIFTSNLNLKALEAVFKKENEDANSLTNINNDQASKRLILRIKEISLLLELDK